MDIRYNEYELLELFLSEPISTYDNPGDGQWLYRKNDWRNFSLSLRMSVYENNCTVSLIYDKTDVFYGDFYDVTELRKNWDELEIYSGEKLLVSIYLGNNIKIRMDKNV